MPAYRAAATLEKTVADIPPGVADELILVDDASLDDTAALARRLGVRVHVHPNNRGYGANQKTCYREALEDGADVVVLLHPDYQYDPKAVPLLVAPILAGYADMTFGSRFAALGDPRAGGMPRYRYVGNRVTTTLENVLLRCRFTEMHSGLRAYTRDCLLSMPFLGYSDDFAFDSQFLIDAISRGKRVVEVPITTRYTKESSSISIARSFRYVGSTLAYCVSRAPRRRRWPRPGIGRAGDVDRTRKVRRRCVLCGAPEMLLLYPSNADPVVDPSEYSCTSDEIAKHDDIVTCETCGMISSVPTLGTDDILDNYERVVDEQYLTEESARRELFGWVLDRIGDYLTPGRRLLEIGSNVGLFLDVAGRSGWQASGIEPSKWAVEFGRRRFGVDLRRSSVEALEPGAPHDVVVALDVLEHLMDPRRALEKMRALIHPEGLLALSTVDVASIHARVRGPHWPWYIRPHLHYFTRSTLDAMLRSSGFRLLDYRIVPRSFHLSYVARRGSRSFGALGTVLTKMSEVADVRVPVGLLGDVVLALARPASATAGSLAAAPAS